MGSEATLVMDHPDQDPNYTMATGHVNMQATCLCSNFDITISLPKTSLPLPATICHCNSCRHSSGALYTSTAALPDNIWQPTASLLNLLQAYTSSSRCTRYFCPTCGCHVLRRDSTPPSWSICTGTLETIEDIVTFTHHAHTEDTLDGGFSTFLPTYAGKPLATNPVPRSNPSTKPQSSSALLAHCACEGTTFTIARPLSTPLHPTAPSPDLLTPFHLPPRAPTPSTPASNKDEQWYLRAQRTKYLAGLCSCRTCRLATGAADLIAWAFVPDSAIHPATATSSSSSPDDSKTARPFPTARTWGTLRTYTSSPGISRRFCGTCGATVFWDGRSDAAPPPAVVDVAVGLFVVEGAGGARAEGWLEWVTARVSFREDGVGRARGLVEGVERGLGAYGMGSRGEGEDGDGEGGGGK